MATIRLWDEAPGLNAPGPAWRLTPLAALRFEIREFYRNQPAAWPGLLQRKPKRGGWCTGGNQ
jgi:hypothetical protein